MNEAGKFAPAEICGIAEKENERKTGFAPLFPHSTLPVLGLLALWLPEVPAPLVALGIEPGQRRRTVPDRGQHQGLL